MTDANTDQSAADAYEQAEAPAAKADQKAVDAANDTAAHNQDDAAKAGNDTLAADAKTKADDDATAAQGHDAQVAATVHTDVVNRAQIVDAAVLANAAQANQDVRAAAAPAPAAVTAAVSAQVGDAHAQNAAATAQSIALADAERSALRLQVLSQGGANEVAARTTYDADLARPLNDPVFSRVNPPQPESLVQILNDYIPYASWGTIATTAGLVAGGAALTLIPGAGPVLLVAGLGLLAASAAYNASDRYFNQNQTLMEALVGGVGTATGVGTLWTGFTGRDIGTGRHLGLTVAQQRQMILPGVVEVASTALMAVSASNSLASFAGEAEAVAPRLSVASAFDDPAALGGGTLNESQASLLSRLEAANSPLKKAS